MNPFSELPDNFFIPLAYSNKEHYANLILIFYNLFLEYSTGVEREVIVSAFEEYFIILAREGTIAPEEDDDPGDMDESGTNPRALASLFLRKLVRYGWISEEMLADYTQVINISAWAKPFIQALHTLSLGSRIEYESHVVAVYSSLCSDSARDNGHHAVLNAHYHTRMLIESLKVLAQNIKNHVQKIFDTSEEIKDLLHIHYDIYMHEVIDKAYTRLKTSDNLSKYRPVINKTISGFVKDRIWLEQTAGKLAIIKHKSREETRKLLISMLHEIRAELKNIDPILEEIDDKNRKYSSISTERIKAKLYTDHSLQGKIKEIIQGMIEQQGFQKNGNTRHRICRNRYLSIHSLYKRPKIVTDINLMTQPPVRDDFEIERLHTELILKIRNQLNPHKIAEFLDDFCCRDGTPTPAGEIVHDMESFIKVMYAAVYAESREESFPYRVTWEKKEIIKGRFIFKDHSFSRRKVPV